MASALIASSFLIGWAVWLQTIELLLQSRRFSEAGDFRWSLVEKEFPKPVEILLWPFLNHHGFLVLLLVQLLASFFTCLVPAFPYMIVILWPTVFLTSLRFRGSFNGGADAMTMSVLTGFLLIFFLPYEHMQFGLYYIAFQLCFSYVRSGFEKIRRKEWRSGESLKRLLLSKYYGAPPSAARLAHSNFTKPLTWIMLVFELTFPLAAFAPTLTAPYLIVGAVFHLANVYLFGLNRFFWAWLAAYPSVWYISHR